MFSFFINAIHISFTLLIVLRCISCPYLFPSTDFEDANFQDGITEFFKSSGFQEPMPIQAQGWPIAMSGRDLIAIGQTGSGKTLGFLVPAIEHIIQAKMSGSNR